MYPTASVKKQEFLPALPTSSRFKAKSESACCSVFRNCEVVSVVSVHICVCMQVWWWGKSKAHENPTAKTTRSCWGHRVHCQLRACNTSPLLCQHTMSLCIKAYNSSCSIKPDQSCTLCNILPVDDSELIKETQHTVIFTCLMLFLIKLERIK